MSPWTSTLRRVIPLVFAALMGIVAAVLVHQYLLQQRRNLDTERRRLKEMMAQYPEPTAVIVAARDLAVGEPISAHDLTTAQVPKRFIQPYATQTAEELTGLMPLAPMAAGEQVLRNKLRRPEEVPKDATLSGRTPKGKRAVTIAVDTVTGVGGFVRPGDRVDVLWTIQLPGAGQQQGQILTLVLFQDVPVLAVGQEMVGSASRKVEAASAQQYTVTLAMTPQETSFLLFAREQGRIQLSLRSHSDQGPVTVAPASIATLMGLQAGLAEAPDAPKTMRQVEIYKGLKRDVVEVAAEEAAPAAAPSAPAPQP